MKKIYAFVLIAAMTASLTACGSSASTADSSVKAESSAAGTENTAEGEEASEEKQEAQDYAAYCGMWYSVDTSLAEIVLSEGSVSFRGDEYEITDVEVPEGAAYRLFSAEMEDGNCLQLDLLDEGDGRECKTILLYQVNRNSQEEAIELGTYVIDIQYTNGDLEGFEEMEMPAEETDETEGADESDAASAVSEDAVCYLIDHAEMSDGSKKSGDEFSGQEFALVYEATSPCMAGMLFSDGMANLYRIGSDSDGLQLEVEVPKGDGQSELTWIPMAFDEKDKTMTLDFSKTGLDIKKIVLKQTEQKKFFSGRREAIAGMY